MTDENKNERRTAEAQPTDVHCMKCGKRRGWNPHEPVDQQLCSSCARERTSPPVMGCPHTPQCRGSAKRCAHLPDPVGAPCTCTEAVDGDPPCERHDDERSLVELLGAKDPIASNAVADVLAELSRARRKFPRPQASAHEGYAVLAEEVDELWDEVKANAPKERLRAEAVQVAAMALRFIEEVCDG